MARRLAEAVERMTSAFGLSHNADGRGRQEGGTFVVTEIVEVKSVDLVTETATVAGLNESKSEAKYQSEGRYWRGWIGRQMKRIALKEERRREARRRAAGRDFAERILLIDGVPLREARAKQAQPAEDSLSAGTKQFVEAVLRIREPRLCRGPGTGLASALADTRSR